VQIKVDAKKMRAIIGLSYLPLVEFDSAIYEQEVTVIICPQVGTML